MNLNPSFFLKNDNVLFMMDFVGFYFVFQFKDATFAIILRAMFLFSFFFLFYT